MQVIEPNIWGQFCRQHQILIQVQCTGNRTLYFKVSFVTSIRFWCKFYVCTGNRTLYFEVNFVNSIRFWCNYYIQVIEIFWGQFCHQHQILKQVFIQVIFRNKIDLLLLAGLPQLCYQERGLTPSEASWLASQIT